MTIEQELQKLITDIDKMLAPDYHLALSYGKNKAAKNKKIKIFLARVRNYLVLLYNQTVKNGIKEGSPTKTDNFATLRTEIDHQINKYINFLQNELNALELINDIEQNQRQQIITKFLEDLLNQLTQTVQTKINETIKNLENQSENSTENFKKMLDLQQKSEQILLKLALKLLSLQPNLKDKLASARNLSINGKKVKIKNLKDNYFINYNIYNSHKNRDQSGRKKSQLTRGREEQVTNLSEESAVKKSSLDQFLEEIYISTDLEVENITRKEQENFKEEGREQPVKGEVLEKKQKSNLSQSEKRLNKKTNPQNFNPDEEELYLAGKDMKNTSAPEKEISAGSNLGMSENSAGVILEELLLQRIVEPYTRNNNSIKINKITALTDLLEPDVLIERKEKKNLWFLGIDLGNTGIRAVLLNAKTCEQYQIYWREKNNSQGKELQGGNNQFSQPSFDLPNAAVIEKKYGENDERSLTAEVAIENLKIYLNFAVIYYDEEEGETRLEEAESYHQIIQEALEKIFSTFSYGDSKSEERKKPGLKIGAVGLSSGNLQEALRELEGIVISSPAIWSDTYCFNLREAIMRAKLVEDPAKIFFLPEAIATLLAHFPLDSLHRGESLAEQNNRAKIFKQELQTCSLVINIGKISTELALVDIPPNWQNLTHSNFSLWSLAYGINAIEQDILCQLLYPQWILKLNPLFPSLDMELPLPGDADLLRREYLGLRLQSLQIGRTLKEAAKLVKEVLQKQEEFTLKLAAQELHFTRQDLQEKILQPLLENFNEEINKLLHQREKSANMIQQVIITQDTSINLGSSFISWLKSKFPQATLIEPEQVGQVAAGLARLPLFPLILDLPRHQYSDYFLLVELLQTIPNTSFSIEELMELLRCRGINTRVCENRLIGFLNGELPPGLLPLENFDYQQPLFYQEHNGNYRPNFQQCDRLRQYLHTLLSQTEQKLTEPLVANLLP
ncbi:MAG: hypothetical protein DSM107014_02950 [Gomphosphaeria aponina SAG 52.96 = DSM 107014]|uniref:Uncharacterized protein n=1 Tax=Gomphosphaeria aponina SAG 52.96 = DSM 107014 TaxID=1521640 RepID=A0A941JUJ0_9CHRO|nr:hypothetical protein [Gomphosphaeria aponina SAG 52.96 = DSM 107014]